MKKRFDALVVGAGYGGATCAAVLASRGLAVGILDKNRRPGGKAMRVVRGGAVHDLWPISGGPANLSRFHDLAKLIGCPDSTFECPDSTTEFLYLLPDGSRRSMVVPARPLRNPLEMLRLITALGVSPTGLGPIAASSAIATVMPEGVLNRLDTISMQAWIEAFRLPKPFADLLLNLQNLFYVAATDRVPASEGVRTLREIAAGGAGRYHRGGYGIMAEKAVAFVEAHRGVWLPGTRVERILRNADGVSGVATNHGELHAPIVISNAGIQPTVLKLARNLGLPAAYVRRVRSLEPSWAFVGVQYELNAAVFNRPMTVAFSPESAWDSARFEQAENGDWPRDPLLLVTVPALYDTDLGSAHTPQVVLAGVMGSPNPQSPMNRTAIAKVDEMVHRLWPAMRRHVIRRRTFSAAQVSKAARDAVVPGQGGECIGLAQVIGQCGRTKPSPRSPLKGLYFVGCDAGGHGIGTTQAVDSGFNVAELVLSDMTRPPEL